MGIRSMFVFRYEDYSGFVHKLHVQHDRGYVTSVCDHIGAPFKVSDKLRKAIDTRAMGIENSSRTCYQCKKYLDLCECQE